MRLSQDSKKAAGPQVTLRVFRGLGSDPTSFKHDTFVVPGWAVHEHVNHSSEDAVLFSFTDAPVLRALGFEREAAARQA